MVYATQTALNELGITNAHITGDNLKLDANNKLHQENKKIIFGDVNTHFRDY